MEPIYRLFEHPREVDDYTKWAAPACPASEVTLLSQFRYFLWQGAKVCGIVDPETDMVVSLNATTFGKRRRNAWGPYANFLLAHTHPDFRRCGYASTLAYQVLYAANKAGCRRVKSLAGTYAGIRLHWRLGHQFWGVAPGGEIQIDSPLVDGPWPFETTPMQARAVTQRPVPMTPLEIRALLTVRGYATEPEALAFLDHSTGAQTTP